MYIACVFLLLLANATCKPHFSELDEDERQLYRAAYEDAHSETQPHSMADDGAWMVQAKLQEVREWTRALAANLLSTKLKIKELTKKHNAHKCADKKPTYSYKPHQHAPTYQPAPYHPAPYQPAPYQPAPYQPAPYHPAPYHPAPYQPAPYQPTPHQPAPHQPAPHEHEEYQIY